jgi:hypothetical protein
MSANTAAIPTRAELLERLCELSTLEQNLTAQRRTALERNELDLFFYFNERCGSVVWERAHIYRQLTGGQVMPELNADLEEWLEEARKELEELMRPPPIPNPSPAEGGREPMFTTLPPLQATEAR